MDLVHILGYLLAAIMGITLGLFGGGGSILAVPILVYVLGISPVLGTAYSLFIVGVSALVGAIKKHIDKEIDYRVAAIFAIPAILAVYSTRRFLIPLIPEHIAQIGSFTLTKDIALMVFFAIVMLVAAISMIRNKRQETLTTRKKINIGLVITEGLVVGIITGLVGAGGGFLIVPALVLLVGLSMREAIATSLVIIALKSLIGFVGDIESGQLIDWSFLLLFTSFAIGGMLIGLFLATKINANHLKKAFGYFILVMAVFVLSIELLTP
jgi:uncharacterized membrane protein YfcA